MSPFRLIPGWTLFALGAASVVLAQTPVAGPSIELQAVRVIHVAGMAKMVGPDLDIATCLIKKLEAKGPFTFSASPDSADAVLTWTSDIPGGLTRVFGGFAPRIAATLAARNGRVIWAADNRYKKGTTIWGSNTDIPCGLANGLVNKLVRDITTR